MTEPAPTRPADTPIHAKVSRMDRRRAKTRETILDAAEEVFAAGFKAARMEELADAADVSVGAIYNHFSSKEGVLLALTERGLAEFNAELDAAFDASRSALEQVMAVAERYVRFYMAHREVFRIVVIGTDGDDGSEIRHRVVRSMAALLERFEAAISAAIQAEEIDCAYNAASTARFLWGAWNGVITLSLRNDDLALTDTELLDCLDTGRRLINEGLTSPSFRDVHGHSRARLIPPTGEVRAEAPPTP